MLKVEFDRYLITLRLTRPARFHFNHGGVLMGLLCRALQHHDLPAGVIPFACESGRVQFAPQDSYRIGLTIAGTARGEATLKQLAAGLRAVGEKALNASPQPTLAGNFEVVSLEQLPAPDLEAEIALLSGCENQTFRFLSPFRLERPAELKAKG